MKASLWLMPPASVAQDMRALMQEVELVSRTTCGSITAVTTTTEPAKLPVTAPLDLENTDLQLFEPHVTLVGGLYIDNDDNKKNKIKCTLQTKLAGSHRGGIECRVSHVASVLGQWNQALVAVLDRTDSLVDLVADCRQICFGEDLMNPKEQEKDVRDKGDHHNGHFPPLFALPLGEPHLSLYYGLLENSDVSQKQRRLTEAWIAANPSTCSFSGTRIALWKTDPPTMEGVAQWEPLWEIDDLV